MARHNVGAKNGFWKGGRSVASNGYVLIRVGTDHHLADVRGYAYEHRLVAETKIGRRLVAGEHVHHTDGNKQNNEPGNLEVMTGAEHRSEHRAPGSKLRRVGEENPIVPCACGCGATIARYDAVGRPCRFVSGHNTGARRRQPTTASLTVAHGSSSDGAGSFSMVHVEASGDAATVGAALGLGLSMAASMRGDA